MFCVERRLCVFQRQAAALAFIRLAKATAVSGVTEVPGRDRALAYLSQSHSLRPIAVAAIG